MPDAELPKRLPFGSRTSKLLKRLLYESRMPTLSGGIQAIGYADLLRRLLEGVGQDAGT
jgi:hypothetical protein